MELHDFIENRRRLFFFVMGLGLLMLVIDFLNPFTDFIRSWSFVYVLRNFLLFIAPYIPIYFALGYLVEKEDTGRLFFSALWIPTVHYIIKGFILLYMIGQDMSVLGIMGQDVWWTVSDWRVFSLFYFGSFPIFVVAIWSFFIVSMTLGLLFGLLFADRIRMAINRIIERRV